MRRQKKRRVCFLYYQDFTSLLYREAMTLKEQGFDVDIICMFSSKRDKTIKKLYGLNLYQIQARPSAERNTMMYFLRLGLFFFKSLCLITVLNTFRRYHLIHITSPPDAMVFTAVIPKIFGTKIILDIHDIGPELFMRKLHVQESRLIIKLVKFLEKISARFSDHIIIVTDLWRDKLVSRSAPLDKCSVILNVADENIFRPVERRSKKSSNGFNLYYHGSIEEHFGLDTLIDAAPEIKKSISNVVINIYGSKKGRILEELNLQVKRLKMEDFVKFHDGVPFYELPEILSDADIGVVPTKGSVFSDEAVSMKSLEYMALGIPICISKTKAHSFYYDSSMVKFFEPEDSSDLAMGIVALHRNPLEREKLVRNSLTFLEEHGWSQAKKTYIDVVNSLIFKP